MWDDEVSINTYSSWQYKRYITTLRFEKDEHGPSSTQIILGEFLRECPHLECIVLVKEDWTIVLPNPDDSIDRKLRIKFIEMKIDSPTIRQICESKLVNKIVLERVEITYTEPVETTISDIPKVSLESFICIGLNLQNQGFYDLLKQTQVKKMIFVECSIDAKLLDQVFSGEQTIILEELEFQTNTLTNAREFGMSKLRNLTSINIINMTREHVPKKKGLQWCQFPVESNISSSGSSNSQNDTYCTMLNLSLHVQLTSLVIDLCPQNYSLFKKHVFRARSLKNLTLHAIHISIDMSKILERNCSIETICVVGYEQSTVFATKHKHVRSNCKNLKLIDFTISNEDFFKYVAGLKYIEKLNVSRSVVDVNCEEMVQTLGSHESRARLVIRIKYADGLTRALTKSDLDMRNHRVSFIVVN
ncbi:hypothetical protein VCUG_01456 [Vavraia culicis subsp. floridensis]|uniref:Uncharacterized protein n=1 Tax=Vavraia culicis (isolate floridensis) TaxID=948595 RepID=L2GVG9_VAVCU|nr:uncharacterized protein VCUG_01456 [Vavraia culicis subsp. floridensis]ELA47095.2 hypothetical protein VCUG_01456 [Vavraia culicis subsp. floridensis]